VINQDTPSTTLDHFSPTGSRTAGLTTTQKLLMPALIADTEGEYAMSSQDAPHNRPYKTEWDSPKVFRPEARSYANMEELIAHVAEISGADPSSPTSIHYRMVRRGSYVRQQKDGSYGTSFGDPILDSITSPVGEVVVGGRSLGTVQPGSHGAQLVEATICQQGPENLQTCRSEDGSLIVISAPDGSSVRFHAWNDDDWLQWSMGASISTTGHDFVRAQIDSRYYFTAYAQVCTVYYDSDHDANDDYMQQSEDGYGLISEKPHRVESLCRVQWNGHRLAGIVVNGDPCYAPQVNPFPVGWPSDWPPIGPPAAVTVGPQILAFSPSATNPHSTRYVNVSSTFDTDVEIDVSEAVLDPQPGPPTPNPFSNDSGHMTIHPMGAIPIQVDFNGAVGSAGGAATSFQHYSGRFRVGIGPAYSTVLLEGQVRSPQATNE